MLTMSLVSYFFASKCFCLNKWKYIFGISLFTSQMYSRSCLLTLHSTLPTFTYIITLNILSVPQICLNFSHVYMNFNHMILQTLYLKFDFIKTNFRRHKYLKLSWSDTYDFFMQSKIIKTKEWLFVQLSNPNLIQSKIVKSFKFCHVYTIKIRFNIITENSL